MDEYQNLTKDEILRLQQYLVNQGYNLKIDGIWGPTTQAAFESYSAAPFSHVISSLGIEFPKKLTYTGPFNEKQSERYSDSLENPKKNREQTRALQEMLKARGLYKGKIDGIWGPKTQAAFDTYKNEPITEESTSKNESVTIGKPLSVYNAEVRPQSAPNLENFNKNNNQDVINMQQFLIDNGYLSEQDARGGWGPKSERALKSAKLDMNLPEFDQTLDRFVDRGLLGNIVGSINDWRNLNRWKRTYKKATKNKESNEEVPSINMNWDVSKHQLSRLVSLLPSDLTPTTYQTWVGDKEFQNPNSKLRYSNTWDSEDYLSDNSNWLTNVIRSLSSKGKNSKGGENGFSTYLDMMQTSLESPGRGTLGGFSIRTSPLGIFIKDGYEFAAPTSQIRLSDKQSEGYNATRTEMNQKYRAHNNTEQNYFIPWDVYYKAQEGKQNT